MRVVYSEISRSDLMRVYRRCQNVIDNPEGSTRNARMRYIFDQFHKIFPGHIIYTSKNFNYFIQAKKNTLLILCGENNIKVMVYQPRPYSVPKLHNFKIFSEEDKKKFGLDGEEGKHVKDVKMTLNKMIDYSDKKNPEIFKENTIDQIKTFIITFINSFLNKHVNYFL